ncbi:MAG: LamG-like jellyroll fold domain-containing protein, partial [Spirochaetota bacterium]
MGRGTRRLAWVAVGALALAGCFSPLSSEGSGDGEANLPPEVVLSASSSLFLGDTLTATLSATDPDDDPLSWIFRLDSIPVGSMLTDDDITITDTEASLIPDALGVYVIRGTVSDGTVSVDASIAVTVTSGAPAEPTGPVPVDGATATSRGFTLDWDDAARAESYEIYFGTESIPAEPSAIVSTSESPLPQSLDYATSYRWRVVAVNAYGSTAGPVWRFTTPEEPLSPPEEPAGPGPANGSTDVPVNSLFDWDDTPGADSFDLRWRADGGEWQSVAGLTRSDHDPGGLTWATAYQWQVTARNAAGSSDSVEWTFTTEVRNPEPFALLGPADGETGVRVQRVQFSWENSDRADYYELYLGAGSLPADPIRVDGTSYLWSSPSLLYDTVYQWQVVARTNEGGSTASEVSGFRTQLPVPSRPEILRPSDGSVELLPQLTLEWGASSDATSYDLYLGRAIDGEEPKPVLLASGITTTSFRPTYPDDVDFGGTYRWYVVARNAEWSASSLEVSFSTRASQLAAHWTFDATLADSVQPLYPATTSSGSASYVSDRNGVRGHAIRNDAALKSWIQVPLTEYTNDPINSAKDGFSASLWFRDGGSVETVGLFSKLRPSQTQSGYTGVELLYLSPGTLSIVRDGAVIRNVAAEIEVGRWHHVVLSWDYLNGSVALWVNGKEVDSFTSGPFTREPSDIWIGAGRGSAGIFTGAFDDVR